MISPSSAGSPSRASVTISSKRSGSTSTTPRVSVSAGCGAEIVTCAAAATGLARRRGRAAWADWHEPRRRGSRRSAGAHPLPDSCGTRRSRRGSSLAGRVSSRLRIPRGPKHGSGQPGGGLPPACERWPLTARRRWAGTGPRWVWPRDWSSSTSTDCPRSRHCRPWPASTICDRLNLGQLIRLADWSELTSAPALETLWLTGKIVPPDPGRADRPREHLRSSGCPWGTPLEESPSMCVAAASRAAAWPPASRVRLRDLWDG